MSQPSGPIDRRTVLRGVAAAGVLGVAGAGLAACGSDATSGSGGGTGGSAGPVRVATADVPVGGGVIIASGPVVVTQPEAGTFKAFSGVCTHQGCPVKKVADEVITCTCHGSQFAITDGSVVTGPARRALPELTATVQGTEVVVG